jgi:hypothetical protein
MILTDSILNKIMIKIRFIETVFIVQNKINKENLLKIYNFKQFKPNNKNMIFYKLSVKDLYKRGEMNLQILFNQNKILKIIK